jgi:hypothetical protein
MEIQNLGSWIIKFRPWGVITNQSCLIFAELDIDATVSFRSTSTFWSIVNGGESFEEALSKQKVNQSGSFKSIDLFKRELVRTSDFAANHPPLSTKMPKSPQQSSLPLKSGWLLKKRDLFNGWRSRYFVLFHGRVEYYIDQHDTHPRGVISLFGAEISAVKRISINGVPDHYAVM